MALAAAVTWPENISIGRLGRTALSQAAEDGCWHNNSLVKDDCVSEQEKWGCFGTFWKDPSTLIFDVTMISFMNKYLLIVSIKLYVYDCGKWPSQAWQKCAEDKGLLKVSLTIIHHVWINDRRIIDFYRTRVRSLAMLVTNWLTCSVTFSKLDWCDPFV